LKRTRLVASEMHSLPAPPPYFSACLRLAIPHTISQHVRVAGATQSLGASKNVSRLVFDSDKPVHTSTKVSIAESVTQLMLLTLHH
jgi:hypothetical protein